MLTVQYFDSSPESRPLDDQRVVLTGFAGGVNPVTFVQSGELGQRRQIQAPSQPFLTEPFRLSGDDILEASQTRQGVKCR